MIWKIEQVIPNEFPLALMGVLAPRSAHARPSAWTKNNAKKEEKEYHTVRNYIYLTGFSRYYSRINPSRMKEVQSFHDHGLFRSYKRI